MAGYLLETSVFLYIDDLFGNQPERDNLLSHKTVLLQMIELVWFKLKVLKTQLEPVQDIQFLEIQLCLNQGRALLPDSKAGKISEVVSPVDHLAIVASLAGPVFPNYWYPYPPIPG